MSQIAIQELAHLVSDVIISNAKKLHSSFIDTKTLKLSSPDDTSLFKSFAFMNWTLAQGVWSNLENPALRQDLLLALKESLVLKLAVNLSKSKTTDEAAVVAASLLDEFHSYLMAYQEFMRVAASYSSQTARQFALERIQERLSIENSYMNEAVPRLFADSTTNEEVENVALQVNKVAEEIKPKGFFRRLFKV